MVSLISAFNVLPISGMFFWTRSDMVISQFKIPGKIESTHIHLFQKSLQVQAGTIALGPVPTIPAFHQLAALQRTMLYGHHFFICLLTSPPATSLEGLGGRGDALLTPYPLVRCSVKMQWRNASDALPHTLLSLLSSPWFRNWKSEF